jgi:NADH-quinone oxidoreductase subunit C
LTGEAVSTGESVVPAESVATAETVATAEAGPIERGGPIGTLPPLADVCQSTTRGQRVFHPARDSYVATVGALRDSGFALCSDLCAVDYLQHLSREVAPGVEPERFEVVVILTSLSRCERVRVRVQVPERDPRLSTLFGLYPGTEAMEREAYDMFGIVFDDHPDMTRILMPDDWEGHPLRKDYSVGRIPVQFKEAPGPR